jgi:hypothetical protein
MRRDVKYSYQYPFSLWFGHLDLAARRGRRRSSLGRGSIPMIAKRKCPNTLGTVGLNEEAFALSLGLAAGDSTPVRGWVLLIVLDEAGGCAGAAEPLGIAGFEFFPLKGGMA